MNVMLATEPTPHTPDTNAGKLNGAATDHPLLETWSQNESMRHIPALPWMTQKLEVDIRRRAEKLVHAYTASATGHALQHQLEDAFKAFCRALHRLAETAKHARGNAHPPAGDLASRVTWSITHAVAHLNMIDGATFGRRFPVQTLDRSKAEPVYAAFLVVLRELDRIVTVTRQVDPGIDERLLEGLVVLQEPVDDRMLKPIA